MRKGSIIAVVLANFVWGTSVHAQEAQTAAATSPVVSTPTISVLVAQKRPIAEKLTVTGSFGAGELVLVTPEVEGLAVTEYLAEIGDTVEKGQVLARLSSETIDISILQSKAALARNDAAI